MLVPEERTRRVVLALAWTVLAGVACNADGGDRRPDGYEPAGLYSLDEWMTIGSVQAFRWHPSEGVIFFIGQGADTRTREIFRLTLADGSVTQLTGDQQPVEGPGPVNRRRPEPKGNLAVSADGETLYFTTARYFQRMFNLFRMSADGGSFTQLTFNDGIIETSPTPSPDGTQLAYFVRTSGGTKVRLLDLSSDAFRVSWPTLLDPDGDPERDPVWSPDGRHLTIQRGGDIWVHSMDDRTATRLIPPSIPGSNRSPRWSPQGDRVAFLNNASGFAQVGVIEVESGRTVPLTYEQREHSSVSWSPDGRWLTFVRSDSLGMRRELMVAPSDGSAAPRVLVEGPGIRSQPQFSPAGDSIAFIQTKGNWTSDIWLVSIEGGDPRQLTISMGSVDPLRLSTPEEVFYPGPDNLRIPAILYRPPNFDPERRYPVIVALHGHPTQWNHRMNMMWQYFVQKGFVLIAPNPRGSTGFGQGFHDLHDGDRGGTEQEDIMMVLDYLAEHHPYVDMTRKATWGGSGGGYASLSIATGNPGLYGAWAAEGVERTFQAQVIRAPVSSRRWHVLERYVSPARFATEGREPSRTLAAEMGGTYQEFPDRIDERSPLEFVENVEVPQLLFHGLRDGSVGVNESRRWVQRMHELGKGDLIQYVEYPDEDHGLTRYRETVRDRLEKMELFFERTLRLR